MGSMVQKSNNKVFHNPMRISLAHGLRCLQYGQVVIEVKKLHTKLGDVLKQARNKMWRSLAPIGRENDGG